MFGRFSNALDALLAVQEAVEAARRNDYFEMATTSGGTYPFIDLFQKDNDDVVLTAEIPGMKKADIKIEVKNNSVRLSGERKLNHPEDSSFHRVERRNVQFDRTIRLPYKVESEKVEAEYQNGVLTISMPRAESDRPKQIKIA